MDLAGKAPASQRLHAAEWLRAEISWELHALNRCADSEHDLRDGWLLALGLARQDRWRELVAAGNILAEATA